MLKLNTRPPRARSNGRAIASSTIPIQNALTRCRPSGAHAAPRGRDRDDRVALIQNLRIGHVVQLDAALAHPARRPHDATFTGAAG